MNLQILKKMNISQKQQGYEIHMGRSNIELKNSSKDFMNNDYGNIISCSLFKVYSENNLNSNSYEDGFFYHNKITNQTVIGTYIHGIFDSNIFKNLLLKIAAKNLNIPVGINDFSEINLKEFKEQQYNKIADLFRNNIDMEKSITF